MTELERIIKENQFISFFYNENLKRIDLLEKHQGEMSIALETDNKRIDLLISITKAHEDYLRNIDKKSLHDPLNTLENMNILNVRMASLENSETELRGFIEGLSDHIEDLQKERDLGVERLKKLEAKLNDYSPQLNVGDNSPHEKKEGLNFVEAMTKLFEGKKVKRPAWNDYIDIKKITEYKDSSSLFYSAFLANDWMVLDD